VVLEATGGGRGTIASPGLMACSTTCGVDVPEGTVVAVTATADPGSAFTGWGGDAIDCENRAACSLKVTQPLHITAEFQRNVQLSVSVAGRGQVRSIEGNGMISCPGACSETGVLPASFSLRAEPGLGWLFDTWSGACVGVEQDCALDLGVSAPAVVSTEARFRQMYNWAQQIGGWGYRGLDIASGPRGDIAVVGHRSLGTFDSGAFVMAFSSTGGLRYWNTFASSGEFVGERWRRKGAEGVIQRDLEGFG
jgi:hypothetical protein